MQDFRKEAKQERGNVCLKLMDRFLGIPLIILLSLGRLFRDLTPDAAVIRNIALLKTAAIGDTVLISAIVGDLRARFPDANITFFTGSSNYEVATFIPGVNRVIRLSIINPLEAIRKIRESGTYDVWIDFGQWPRLDAFLSYTAFAAHKIGFKTKGQYRHYIYDHIVEHRDDVHELQNFRKLVESLGVSPESSPRLNVEDVPVNRKRVVVHMFPGGEKAYLKEWPDEYWIEVIRTLAANGYEVFLTGSQANKARAEVLSGRIGTDAVKNVAGDYDLKQTLALINSAILTISVNTGIMHAASALQCNLISLNGPTSGVRWGALNNNSVSLTSPVACAPCLNLGFEYKCGTNTCMQQIVPEDVLQAVRKFTALN